MAKKRHPALFDVMSSPRGQGRSLVPPTNAPSRSSLFPNLKSWLKKSAQRPEPATDFADEDAAAVGAPAPTPRVPGLDLQVDPDNYQLKFKVTYTSAIISGFAILVIIGLAYLLGSHHHPSEASASDNADTLHLGPANKDVLDLTPAPTNVPKTSTPTNSITPTAPPNTGRVNVPQNDTTPGRVIGQNYVIVQSYPEEDEAIAARELLASNGVPATVEKSLPNWANPNWYTVVGLRGFDRISGPEYEKYMDSIKTLSIKFAKTSKFKKFEPQAYRWKPGMQTSPVPKG